MKHFEQELAELKGKVITMARHAEAAVRNSIRALNERDTALAAQVREEDTILDRFEVELDEAAIRLLAKAPLASDLRLITAAMKISQNLERAGDEAAKIANRARDLAQLPTAQFELEIPQMQRLALEMLDGAVTAFLKMDPISARALVPQDKAVDKLNKEMQAQLVAEMTKSSQSVSACVPLMVAVKSIERIADHAKNIAEEVVFLCEAEDIRHLR